MVEHLAARAAALQVDEEAAAAASSPGGFVPPRDLAPAAHHPGPGVVGRVLGVPGPLLRRGGPSDRLPHGTFKADAENDRLDAEAAEREEALQRRRQAHADALAVDGSEDSDASGHGEEARGEELEEDARGEVSFEDFEDVDTVDLDGDDDFDDLDLLDLDSVDTDQSQWNQIWNEVGREEGPGVLDDDRKARHERGTSGAAGPRRPTRAAMSGP